MAEKKRERHLPEPPASAFGRRKNPEQDEAGHPLMADRLAKAAAEGRLQEFLDKELPDSEPVRALVSMMLGMTGMLPGEGIKPSAGPHPGPSTEEETAEAPRPSNPPEDLLNAVRSGNVEGLMGILKREHETRSPREAQPVMSEAEPSGGAAPTIDKEVIDRLVGIAAENNLSLDWMILRALKVYVREYEKTGRL